MCAAGASWAGGPSSAVEKQIGSGGDKVIWVGLAAAIFRHFIANALANARYGSDNCDPPTRDLDPREK